MLESNMDAVKYRLSTRGKSRYIVVSVTGDWYVGVDAESTLRKYKSIDFAKAYYAYDKAVTLYERCIKAGWECEIIKYDITYTPVEVKKRFVKSNVKEGR